MDRTARQAREDITQNHPVVPTRFTVTIDIDAIVSAAAIVDDSGEHLGESEKRLDSETRGVDPAISLLRPRH